MTFGSLFAGIGGMDLGLERAGMECRWQVEIDPFCRRVLTKHWPNVPKYGDICELTGNELEPVDLIAGGFPCQDVSMAGARKGVGHGTRSGLYREYLRLVAHLRPKYVLMENVAGLLVPTEDGQPAPISRVLGDLAEGGFDAEWDCIPAVAFGAPHQRDRAFILAHTGSAGLPRRVFAGRLRGITGQAPAEFGNRNITCGGWWFENRANLRMGDGVPLRMARRRIKALGNAVVPQVAEWIGRRIMEASAEVWHTD